MSRNVARFRRFVQSFTRLVEQAGEDEPRYTNTTIPNIWDRSAE